MWNGETSRERWWLAVKLKEIISQYGKESLRPRIVVLPYVGEIYHDNFVEFLQHLDRGFIDNLARNCGDFETFVDSAEYFMEGYRSWLEGRRFMWARMARAIGVKYNLIHNTDRTEEDTVTVETDAGGSSTDVVLGTVNGSNTHTAENSDTVSSTNLHQLSAANQTGFHNKDQDVISGETGTNRNERDKITSETEEEVERTHNQHTTTTTTHKNRAFGNIGVTTNQQMLQQELELAKFDLVRAMVDDFKKEFCIMIY